MELKYKLPRNINSPLVTRILGIIYHPHEKNVSVKFLWIPSHIGVSGNERADILAKMASDESTLANPMIPTKNECEKPVERSQVIALKCKEQNSLRTLRIRTLL